MVGDRQREEDGQISGYAMHPAPETPGWRPVEELEEPRRAQELKEGERDGSRRQPGFRMNRVAEEPVFAPVVIA